jgi:hypothetical protein
VSRPGGVWRRRTQQWQALSSGWRAIRVQAAVAFYSVNYFAYLIKVPLLFDCISSGSLKLRHFSKPIIWISHALDYQSLNHRFAQN